LHEEIIEIVRNLLHRAGYIEKMGTGINKMRRLIAEAGLPPIEFEFGTFFTATFRRPEVREAVGLETRVERMFSEKYIENFSVNFSVKFSELLHHEGVRDGVNEGVKARLVEEIAYLYTQGGIKRTEMETSFDISTATAERDLSILKRIGIIVFKGAPKTGRYILTEKGKKMIEELRKDK
jgi:ATP-dependent DNA helicase RecG